MRLEDLPRINELAAALKRLDESGSRIVLAIAEVLEIAPEDAADFVEWKRGRINAELRPLIDGAAPPAAEPTALRDGAAVARVAHNHEVARSNRAPATKSKAVPRMTRAAALAEARRRILGSFEKELRARGGGLADEQDVATDLAIYTDKRRLDIEELARELMRGPQVNPCCVCGRPATTIIAGQDYCTADAKEAPRMAPEAGLRLVG